MPNPYASQCHTTGRGKMATVSGSPKNFESPADKANRFVMSNSDGQAALPDKKPAVTNTYADGGGVHGDEAQDKKLISKMMNERGCK
jgi:hypothetical protein